MENSFTRVEKLPAPLRARIVAKLRTAITEGVFKPGDRLVEIALAQRLQVSRPSIREAIRQLEAEGLVEIVPNRGPVVRSLSLQELCDIDDTRALVEGQCARLFVERGTKEDIERLEAHLNGLAKAIAGKKRDEIVLTKSAYYEAFIAGSHSELIQSLVRQLNARVSYLWSSGLSRPGRVTASLNEMRHLLAEIRARDADAACDAAQTNVRNGKITGLLAIGQLDKDQKAEPRRRVR